MAAWLSDLLRSQGYRLAVPAVRLSLTHRQVRSRGRSPLIPTIHSDNWYTSLKLSLDLRERLSIRLEFRVPPLGELIANSKLMERRTRWLAISISDNSRTRSLEYPAIDGAYPRKTAIQPIEAAIWSYYRRYRVSWHSARWYQLSRPQGRLARGPRGRRVIGFRDMGPAGGRYHVSSRHVHQYFLELEIIESWRFARVTHVLRFLYSPRGLPDLFPYFTHRLSLFLWKICYL